VLGDWKRRNIGILPKSEFPRLFKLAVEQIGAEKLSSNAVSGFKAAGILHFNPQAVLKNLPRESEGGKGDEMDDSWPSSVVEYLKSLSVHEKNLALR